MSISGIPIMLSHLFGWYVHRRFPDPSLHRTQDEAVADHAENPSLQRRGRPVVDKVLLPPSATSDNFNS